MARHLPWAFALLICLSSSTNGRAAEFCDTIQQRAGGGPAAAKSGNDQRGDEKGGDSSGHQGPRRKWWSDPQLRAELGITDQQSKLVEQVWQKSAPKLREAWAQLEKLEEALSQMLARDDADEAAIVAQIERVEAARAEGNTRRTLMIYRMNKVLTPDQRTKVKAMMERRDGGRRGPASR